MFVQISFKGNLAKLYDYKTDLELKKGEPVVVPTGSGFSVGVVEKTITKSNKATAWVVQKVDVKLHRDHVELEEMLL